MNFKTEIAFMTYIGSAVQKRIEFDCVWLSRLDRTTSLYLLLSCNLYSPKYSERDKFVIQYETILSQNVEH